MALSTSFQTTFGSHPHHVHAGVTGDATSAQAAGTNPVQTITTQEAIEVAGRNVEKMIHSDSQFPSLTEKLRIGKSFNDC